jgi:RNA recognition motif-containing protein
VGNLGNEVDDNSLIRAFQGYPSFQRAKVIFDKRLRKTRGYGFVSFRNAECFSKALREMQVRAFFAVQRAR